MRGSADLPVDSILGRLSRNELTVAVADGTGLDRLARELLAFEAEFHALSKRAGRDFAELVLLGNASRGAVGALARDHPRTLLTRNAADTNLHLIYLSFQDISLLANTKNTAPRTRITPRLANVLTLLS